MSTVAGSTTTTKATSPLTGAGASVADLAKIEAALLESKDVKRVIHLTAAYTTPGNLLVGAKIDVAPSATLHEVFVIINLAERRVRAAMPAVLDIYIEPDIYLDPDIEPPPTSAIVTLSSN